jgi:hypothetical protein
MNDDHATETPEQFDAFLEAIDRSLTDTFGPDHQAILSQGLTRAEFVW